ncbi:MAG: patatin-like phospholipase family protein [Flavobacteriales bacterium]
MGKKALVLSGGSIKGAFQAGAVKAVLETSFAPEIITGISVGSLNGTLIANEAGRQKRNNQTPDWPGIGKYVYEFWANYMTRPESVVLKRKKLSILSQFLRKRFQGFTDSKPIDYLIDQTVDVDNLSASDIELAVGTVNFADAKITYAEPSSPGFKEYLKASKAIPFIMQCIDISGHPYADGGLRDSAPLKTTIRKGASEIICILNHSRELAGISINAGNAIALAQRIMDIHINETVNNDIEYADYCNRFLPDDGSPKPDEPFLGYRKIKITVIRPETEVILDLQTFTKKEIHETMQSGYHTARKILNA